MEKIINKRRYSTDSAECIGTWDNGQSGLNFITESLYRKRNGEFFLYCEGGANTKYCKKLSANSWAPGASIIPVSAEDAETWGREHLEADKYAALFGQITEDNTPITRTYSFSAQTVEILKRLVAKDGGTISGVIEKAVHDMAVKEGII